jgi:hypothetical protein
MAESLEALSLGEITPELMARDASFLREAYPEFAGASDNIVFRGGMMKLSRMSGRPVDATIGGQWFCVSAPSEEQEMAEFEAALRAMPAHESRGTAVDVYPVEVGTFNGITVKLR